jgi:hypothetical protein
VTLPFTLPAWLPPWAFLLLALPVLLWALAFMLMPFSVFGVKARLDTMEAQIDSLHEEVRNLAIRSTGMLGMVRPTAAADEDILPNFGRLKSTQRTAAEAPAPLVVEPRVIKPVPRPARRMEPRLD